MKRYQIAIVEDDLRDFANAQDALARYSLEKKVEFKISRFDRAETFLENYRPVYDIVFLDIELPGMNGMDAAVKLRRFDPKVILFFLTNLSNFALKGYRVEAMDYILKPVNYYSLALRLANAIKKIESASDYSVLIRLAEGVKVVLAKDIYYIDIMNHDVLFHTTNGTVNAYGSLTEREKELTPYGFSRCSACALVNMRYIEGIFGDEISVGGDKVHISRGRKKEFLREFTAYLGTRGKTC